MQITKKHEHGSAKSKRNGNEKMTMEMTMKSDDENEKGN